jgi:hypothetical protein
MGVNLFQAETQLSTTTRKLSTETAHEEKSVQ